MEEGEGPLHYALWPWVVGGRVEWGKVELHQLRIDRCLLGLRVMAEICEPLALMRKDDALCVANLFGKRFFQKFLTI